MFNITERADKTAFSVNTKKHIFLQKSTENLHFLTFFLANVKKKS